MSAVQLPILLRRAGRALLDLAVDQSFNFRTTRRGQRAFIREILSKTNGPDNRRVIVSMSTLPDRIDGLGPTLDSWLKQTRPPDEIVIAVPKFSVRQERPYSIPKYLEQIPRVRILHSEKDWGPATKFIPLVQSELAAGRGDTLIVAGDDDRIYPRDAIALYLHYSAERPDAALCFRGGLVPREMDWRWPLSKFLFGVDVRKPERVAIVTGCGSYLIRPRYFDETLWDYSAAPAGAFYMDDMWISGCLDRRGIAKYVIPASRMMRTALRQLGTMTLHDVPRGRRQNNNETLAFFAKNWKVFDSSP